MVMSDSDFKAGGQVEPDVLGQPPEVIVGPETGSQPVEVLQSFNFQAPIVKS